MEDKKLLTIALLELAKQNRNELKRIEKRLAEILGVKDEGAGYYGHVSDGIWSGEMTADELFSRLKVD